MVVRTVDGDGDVAEGRRARVLLRWHDYVWGTSESVGRSVRIVFDTVENSRSL